MRAIVISGMSAAGKTSVAAAIGKRLGIKKFDGSDILRKQAKRLGYNSSGRDWWGTKEGLEFTQRRLKDPKFDRKTHAATGRMIAKGNIVLTTAPEPWLTRKGFNVWLSASFGKRAKNLAKRDKVTINNARKILRRRDRNNRDLFRRLYGIRFGRDKKPFDLIVDTDNLGISQIADIIIKKFKE